MNKFKLVFGILFIVFIGCQNITNDQLRPDPDVIITKINPLVDSQAQQILRDAFSVRYN